VITNIYNKKTKGPTLMESFTATGKLIFLTTKGVRCDTAHIDTILKFLPHTHQSTCLHRHSSLLQWFSKLFIPRTNGLVCGRVLCVLCTKCRLHSNHRITRVILHTQNDFSLGAAIFLLHTLASPSVRNVNYDEKQLSGVGDWVVPSIYTGFVNMCPTVFLS
jgi:hypothetical protein